MTKKLLLKILTYLMLSISILPVSNTFAEELNPKVFEGKVVQEEVNEGVREGYVDVPDVSLKKTMNKAIGQREDADIPKAKLEKLTQLYTRFSDISNLEGIQYCTNLKELNLQGNEIKDISLLRNLKNLKVLLLNGNPLQDISVLTELPNLRELYLNAVPIKDVTELGKIKNLRELYLAYSSEIKDIAPLTNLKNLKELSIRGTSVKDISPLQELPELRHLDLANNRIDNLEVINKLKFLRSINLYDNGLENIDMLKNLNWLEWVSLEENNIKDLSPLKSSKYLMGLSANNNNIEDISSLKNLTKLFSLDISNNNISDISVLDSLYSLESVKLENQKITLKNKEVNGRLILENPIKSIDGYEEAKNLSNDGQSVKANKYLTWNNIKDNNINNLSFNFNKQFKVKGEKSVFSGTVVQPLQFNANALRVEDINKDKSIDINDLANLGIHYNKKDIDENWNEDCDLNKDGIIDIFDLVIVSKEM